ncbi:capsule biosynthesis protein CapA [Rhodobacterales bacterium HKCCE3408]|nr:capsule biosynthesis protein CapA [Rhodobacterales bacterium HKCCE3408]
MDRSFVFLQGPHGPFFARLARTLAATGADVRRIGFTAGDRAFWPRALPYRAFTGTAEDWEAGVADILAGSRATDLVIYGDTRAHHAAAIRAARRLGITVHVFEEGYLRPYWITYERDGANGHSRLMALTDDEIASAVGDHGPHLPAPPARWGTMRAHVVYGALYHAAVLVANRRYARFRPHRALTVAQEFRLYFRLLATMVPRWMMRVAATRAIRRGGFPYHLVLLQLAHDANFRDHGPFPDMGAFLAQVIEGFAAGAPAHHHLVFKAHPLEDRRFPIQSAIGRLTRQHGLDGRVHFVGGGKLAPLLDEAETAVTVTSTAAQQALWRGLPVKAFGRAVYARPGFTSKKPLADFFADPDRPDAASYDRFRRFLLATSQVAGSYYTASGRRRLMRRIPDRMLAGDSPYDALLRGNSAPISRLKLVD